MLFKNDFFLLHLFKEPVCRRRTSLQSCPKKEFQRSLIISIEANKWCQFWLKDNCSCRLGKWRVFYNSLTKYIQIAYNSTFSDCATRHKKYLWFFYTSDCTTLKWETNRNWRSVEHNQLNTNLLNWQKSLSRSCSNYYLTKKWWIMKTCQPISIMIRKKSWFPWAHNMVVDMMTIFEEVCGDEFPKKNFQ